MLASLRRPRPARLFCRPTAQGVLALIVFVCLPVACGHFDGSTWKNTEAPWALFDVAVGGPKAAWAAGPRGGVVKPLLAWDGAAWKEDAHENVPSEAMGPLFAVSSREVWVSCGQKTDLICHLGSP